MAKHTRVDQRFYDFARRLREESFERDGSLFRPGEAIWTPENLGRLHAAYVGQADEGDDDYWTKLGKQLDGLPAGCVDLMAEMQFVQTLGAMNPPIKAETILEQMEKILTARRPAREVPEEIADSVTIACRNPGQSLHQHRYWQLRFLLEATIAFKKLDAERRAELLAEPDAWRAFLDGIDVQAAQSMRNHLLHLVHPEHFELITSDAHKEAIAKALTEPGDDAEGSVDATLRKIRARLEEEHGVGFQFSDAKVMPLWQKEITGLESARVWKIAPGEGARVWTEWKEGGYASMGWTDLGDLTGLTTKQWEAVHAEACETHGWTKGGPKQPWRLSTKVRVGDLILANRGQNEVLGVGRVTDDYYFVPGEDFGHRVPVEWLGVDPFPVSQGGWNRTMIRVRNPLADRVRAMAARKLTDGPSVVEALPPDGLPRAPNFATLAHDLCLGEADVIHWADLLRHKKQLVFYGPPGTGKTYIARKLAAAFTGDPTRVELVQFHPSYAYEDFVEGYRPRQGVKEGAVPFRLVEGPLKRLAGRATNDPDRNYVLVIDEINRGNLPAIFGELFFLLEYRDALVNLQYGGGDGGGFALPANLHVIGTMNTADRSIALFDAALRRRFFFLPFFPDAAPLAGPARSLPPKARLGRGLDRRCGRRGERTRARAARPGLPGGAEPLPRPGAHGREDPLGMGLHGAALPGRPPERRRGGGLRARCVAGGVGSGSGPGTGRGGGSLTRELEVFEHGVLEVALSPVEVAALLAVDSTVLKLSRSAGPGEVYRLQAGRFVGVLALDEAELVLHLRPKLPVKRVLFLLRHAQHRTAYRRVDSALAADAPVSELLGWLFVEAVAAATRGGLLHGYLAVEEDLRVLRGRPDFARQLRRRPGRWSPVAVRHRVFTPDVAENRALLAAVDALLAVPSTDAGLRSALRRCRRGFEGVSAVSLSAGDADAIPRHRLNGHYAEPLALAALVLRGAGVRPSPRGDRFRCFLLDLAAVFEAFLVNRLRAALNETEASFPRGERVHREKRLPLDDERSSFLTPDLSRWMLAGPDGRRRCVLIGDVKYRAIEKASPFDADLKQALAYAVVAGLSEAWLVYATPGGTSSGVSTQTIRGRRVHRVGVDLDREPDGVLAQVAAPARRLAGVAVDAPG